jgi:hypothetical protein
MQSDTNYIINHNKQGQTTITIPTPRNYLIMVFCLLGLCIPVFLMRKFLYFVNPTEDFAKGGILLFILIIFFFGSFIVNYLQEFIWILCGSEVFTLSDTQLIVSRKYVLLYKAKEFDLNKIANFQIAHEVPFNRKYDYLLLSQRGYIQFEYNKKTIEIGREVEKEDAEVLVDILEKYRNRVVKGMI